MPVFVVKSSEKSEAHSAEKSSGSDGALQLFSGVVRDAKDAAAGQWQVEAITGTARCSCDLWGFCFNLFNLFIGMNIVTPCDTL